MCSYGAPHSTSVLFGLSFSYGIFYISDSFSAISMKSLGEMIVVAHISTTVNFYFMSGTLLWRVIEIITKGGNWFSINFLLTTARWDLDPITCNWYFRVEHFLFPAESFKIMLTMTTWQQCSLKFITRLSQHNYAWIVGKEVTNVLAQTLTLISHSVIGHISRSIGKLSLLHSSLTHMRSTAIPGPFYPLFRSSRRCFLIY